MSIADDDDLPVLTQVLRTGSGHPPRSGHDDAFEQAGALASMDARVHPDDVGDGDGEGETPWPRALVIGSDPEPQDDARIDLRQNDVFLRTAPTDASFADRIDEPPLLARRGVLHSGDGDEPLPFSGALSRDVPLVFGDRPARAPRDHDATFAVQVRDSVLHELSARIDTELDARIAQTLHAELESALAHLQASLRVELGEALRDVVGHAVDDAILRLRDAPPSDDGRV